MSGEFMVVLIVLIGVIGGIVKSRHRAAAHLKGTGPDADTLRLTDEVRALKERIAVLERVVTDNHGSLGLDREIERLRDR